MFQAELGAGAALVAQTRLISTASGSGPSAAPARTSEQFAVSSTSCGECCEPREVRPEEEKKHSVTLNIIFILKTPQGLLFGFPFA